MKRMLFNATHAEETRVAIIDGQKLVDIDIEIAGHESRKSNIYKGIITRIEPSLEACFVDYGDVKHGFLSFKEVGKQYFKEGTAPSSAKIQEALHVGQELLVQMEKEERGNKGAALTSFISLAGRYMVLMPNNPRGGGVSRRIDGEDRAELRALMDQLQVPEGMGVIARTAAIDRTLEELQWDLNYLLQLWKAIDGASQTKGAFLIYQESSLIIRAIRDYFSADIKQILIDNDDVYEQARQFVGYVMPDMAERVVRYNEDVPLFTRFQIEHQIETAHSRQVPLPSGGSIVIDHTEALVAIDVNSARSTRGGDIEETATRTNLEAAEEAARQLRLRDLGGLVVIDFIDMEDSKNQRAVEAKLKEGLRHDRARLQMGKISRFGLMELSRQRLRPSLAEGSHTACPRCNGVGSIRDVNSTALHILRLVQEEAMKDGTAALHVQVPVDVATFLLNEKRADLAKLETKLNVSVILIPNRHIETPNYKLDRLKHDDSRLDSGKPTHNLVETPEEQDLSKNKSQAKAAQIAKVTGVTPPERPAMSERSATQKANTQAAQSAGKAILWQRVKAFFTGAKFDEASSPPQTPAQAADSNRTARGAKNTRNERGDRNNRRNAVDTATAETSVRAVNVAKNKVLDERKVGDRAERPPRSDRAPRDPNAPRAERSPRPAKNERPARHDSDKDAAVETVVLNAIASAPPEVKVIRDSREVRAERGESRRPHSNRQAKPLVETDNEEPINADTHTELNAISDGMTHEAGERTSRARNRRGGRGRNKRDSGDDLSTETMTQSSDISSNTLSNVSSDKPLNVPAETSLNAAAAVAVAKVTPIAPALASVASTPVVTVLAVVEPKSAPMAAAPIMPIRLDEAPLQSLSKDVGLEWVNTDNAAFAAAQAKLLNQAKPARVPRERPARVAVLDEPLQLMETHKGA
jgi:ribonuclease E